MNSLLALLFAAGASLTTPEVEPVVELPSLDHQQLLARDLERAGRGEPVHHAVPHAASGVAVRSGQTTTGHWSKGPNGFWRWTFTVKATGASSVDLGFDDYWLPAGAELWVSDATGKVRRGPYTDRHNQPHRQLWTPVVPGDAARVELIVPEANRDHVSLALKQVNYGYRFYNEREVAKSLSCNVDVICPAGDEYRDQIRSVAMYTNGSGRGLCSGTLLDNTAGDGRPYFLTASHCGVSASEASSLVFYFNYESDTCRTGADSGNPLPRSIGDTVSGASLIAGNSQSDFTLLELSQMPPTEFGVFYAGWDRRDLAPAMGVGIHHPLTHEKRLAIELDPIVDSADPRDFFSFELDPFTYWEVLEWDVGITEGGSSGSGLFNQDKRLVGQLAGGARFSCPGAEEGSDVYGKLSVSWEAGSTPQTRLSDWLDPVDSGASTLDGSDGCDQPQLTLDVPGGTVTVGDLLTFGVDVTGGMPPYDVEWDLDGDGEIDSRLAAFQARFDEGGQHTISLRVTDALGCPAMEAVGLPVAAPHIEIHGVGDPQPVCGDSDGRIERGEIWSFPVTLANTGDAPALDVVAGFRVSLPDNTADGFGYALLDSSEGVCPFDALDISASGQRLEIDDADDDGVIVELGASAPFDFYGQDVTNLTMSTNGYLSTSAEDMGVDFDNDCPLPAMPNDGGGARIMPLHDDLVAENGLFHQYFDVCPRPADTGDRQQGCDVMQWNDVGFFSDVPGTFDFQVLLYEQSAEIVFLYPEGNQSTGAGSTTGIQNAGFDTALTYACNTPGSVAADSAVCIFHPDSPGPAKSDRVRLLTPAVTLDRLSIDATETVMVDFFIEQDFACGDFFALDFLGAGFRGGFSRTAMDGALSMQVSDEPCVSIQSCSSPSAGVEPRDGFWFNALRPGNGMDLHFGPGLYAAWYTAHPDRTPLWYYIQTLTGEQLEDSQIRASLLEFRGPVGEGLTADFEIVGEAVLSLVDPSRALMTWTLDGRRDGELIEFFDLNAGMVDPDVTDQWFNSSEPGWGFGFHRQGEDEFAAVYFYDTDDLPVWTVVLETDRLRSGGESRLGAFFTHCPACVWTTPTFVDAGRLLRRFDAPSDGTVDIEVDTAIPVPIQWQRLGLPIQPIRSIVEE